MSVLEAWQSCPMSAGLPHEQAEPATEQLPLAPHDHDAVPAGRRRRMAPWVIATAVVLVAAGVSVVVAMPFASPGTGNQEVAIGAGPTGIYTLARGDLSSQTQVSATLGYGGSFSIAAPSGASAQDVAQAQQTVTADQQTLSADEQVESDQSNADGQAIAALQANVTADQSNLSSDQDNETQACAGSESSSSACSSATEKVSADQMQSTQAQQQLTSAESTTTLDRDQNQAKVQADQTKLMGDQSTLASLRATELNPGTAYTALPQVGDVIKEDQPVYSLSDDPVPLLYGAVPAYRAFYVGMSDGADVGELTADLIGLGYGGGLTQSNHYSSATASAVEHWQSALGLPATGEILLGAAVFEPGPIRVTSVTPSVGSSVGGGGGGASSNGSGGGGGGSGEGVLSATSTTRQVSIALDASDQSEVAVGDKVSITLPNNETTPGVISSVGTVATSSSSGSGDSSSSASGNSGSGSLSPTITVLVNPTDPAATGDWDQASVNVTITTGSVTNALVVPVAALRAQPSGGYAVEVIGADDFHQLVAVNLGLFDDADGMVQVSGTSLATGQQVVVPKL
jgi:multidrug efflux pump subunit AcrA (membrane-fusion protein)